MTAASTLAVVLAWASISPPRGTEAQTVLEQFIARREAVPLTQYRAIRRMWARNDRFKREARLTVRTTLDERSGFRYDVLAHEGSALVRDRALLPILKAEGRALSDGTAARSALTMANYEFIPGHDRQWLLIRPRRRDSLLVQGTILIDPADGDLRRIEGRLAKSPSFWTSRVEVVRDYQRIGAVRVPIRLASFAWIRLVGVSMFETTYEYEEINGAAVRAQATER